MHTSPDSGVYAGVWFVCGCRGVCFCVACVCVWSLIWYLHICMISIHMQKESVRAPEYLLIARERAREILVLVLVRTAQNMSINSIMFLKFCWVSSGWLLDQSGVAVARSCAHFARILSHMKYRQDIHELFHTREKVFYCLHRQNPKSYATLYLPVSRHAHKRVISNAKVLLTTPTRFVIESSRFMIHSYCKRRIEWQSRFWLAIRGQPTALSDHSTVDVRQLCWGDAPTSVPCNLQMNQRTQFREGEWPRIVPLCPLQLLGSPPEIQELFSSS